MIVLSGDNPALEHLQSFPRIPEHKWVNWGWGEVGFSPRFKRAYADTRPSLAINTRPRGGFNLLSGIWVAENDLERISAMELKLQSGAALVCRRVGGPVWAATGPPCPNAPIRRGITATPTSWCTSGDVNEVSRAAALQRNGADAHATPVPQRKGPGCSGRRVMVSIRT